MDEIFARNVLYWGDEAQKIIASSHIAVFGLGGVGAELGVGGLCLCAEFAVHDVLRHVRQQAHGVLELVGVKVVQLHG